MKKKSPIFLFSTQPGWAVMFCQAAGALHGIRNTFTHLSCSLIFFGARQILYWKQNLEQALAFKINKLPTLNANLLQEQSRSEKRSRSFVV